MNAVRIAAVGLGDDVAVIGLGLVGQLVAQLARLQGGAVVGLDLRTGARRTWRRSLARITVFDAGDRRVRRRCARSPAGAGADCVIVAAAAKSDAPARQALELCRDRGRIVVVGAVNLNFPWSEMYSKEIQLLMSRAYGPGSYDPEYEKKGRDYPVSYVRWTERRNMEEFVRLVAASARERRAARDAPVPARRGARKRTQRCSIPPSASACRAAAVSGGGRAVPDSNRAAPWKIESCGLEPPGELAGGAGRRRKPGALGAPAEPEEGSRRLLARGLLRRAASRGRATPSVSARAYCTSEYADDARDPRGGRGARRQPQPAPRGGDRAALRAGKHVFVEKPMALTEEECRKLTRAVERDAASSSRWVSTAVLRRTIAS